MNQILNTEHARPFGRWDLGFGILFFTLYALTLAPNVLPADAGEYQITGALLGVAHPPGYALYTLLSWLTTQLIFFLPPATAINLLSAILAALTLVCVSRATRSLTGSAWAGVGAALALGLSTTFWAQATTANVRMLTACAIAWAVERLVVYRAHPSTRALGWVALALGIAVSHHGSTIFLAAALGAYALWLNPRAFLNGRVWLKGALPFVAWLYLPLRAGAYGAPPQIATFNGFLEHILARGFQGDMLYFATAEFLPTRLALIGQLATFQFAAPVLGLMLAGGVAALWRARDVGVALLVAGSVHSFIALTYRAPQTVEYLLPTYVLLAVLMGFAWAELFRWGSITLSPRHLVTLSVCAITLIAQARATAPSYFTLARDTSTRTYAQEILNAAPPDAVILTGWHWATPLWYLQNVEGQRADVEVRYVFPRTASLAQDWLTEMGATLPTRPVLVTYFFPAEFNAAPYRFVPIASAWQVLKEPLMQSPLELSGGLEIGGLENWRFLGHSPILQSSNSHVTFTAAWQTSAAPRDINFFAQLIGPEGALYGQMDVSHAATRYLSGEVLLDRYTLTPYPDAPPGTYAVRAGAYAPDGTRLAEIELASITLKQTPTSALGVPLGDVRLLNTTFSSATVRPGQTLLVDLDLLAARPLINDYTISVALVSADYQWRVASDATPVDGALPTLKWLAGSRLTDRHALLIPADATPGTAHIYLVIYDAFTQQPLPLLDRDLAAQGPALWLGTVEIAP